MHVVPHILLICLTLAAGLAPAADGPGGEKRSFGVSELRISMPDLPADAPPAPVLLSVIPPRTAHVDHGFRRWFIDHGFCVVQLLNAQLDSEAVIAGLASEYAIDRSAVFLLGFSASGASAMQVALHNPGLYRGAISICHGLPPESGQRPGAQPALLLVTGDGDQNYRAVTMLARIYRDRGYDSTLLDIPGLGHRLRSSELPALLAWIQQRRH